VREQRIDEERSLRVRMRGIGMPRFGGEGVALEPVEQFGAVARDDIELGAVDVAVDEAGQQQPATMIVAHPARIGCFGWTALMRPPSIRIQWSARKRTASASTAPQGGAAAKSSTSPNSADGCAPAAPAVPGKGRAGVCAAGRPASGSAMRHRRRRLRRRPRTLAPELSS
jgi:hypothetical protein